MPDKRDQLTGLLEEYPELGTGLHEFVAESDDQLVSLVGIFSVLQLRLRSVVALLPKLAPPEEEDRPGPA